ncbi:MAG: GNAT family N-acetyltransferase [Chitinophagales bacterium]
MNTNWNLKRFDELTTQELYDILHLRSEVFVVEQDCVYQDLDYLDQDALHLIAYAKDKLVAYVRIIPPKLKYKAAAAIGRVVSSPTVRGKGIGKALMKKAIIETQKLYPEMPIKISAQCYLDQFYKDLGFKVISEVYLEDGIDHQEMILG